MDAWNKYNMARLRFGLDAELDPYQLALATQTNDKNIHEKMCPYLVSLKSKKVDGSIHPAGTGFYIIHDQHLLVTAAHVVSAIGSTDQLVAFYSTGVQSDVKVIAKDMVADIAVIKVDHSCSLPSVRFIDPCIGETVYILGFSSGSQLNFTKGMVTSKGMGTFTTSAYADNGFSGGPVFNLSMELVGMVLGGAGFAQGLTNQQVRCVTVDQLDGFVKGILAMQPTCGGGP